MSDYFSQKSLQEAKRMSNRNSVVVKTLREFADVFQSDETTQGLYCKVCDMKVNADKPQTVQTHLKTIKHTKNSEERRRKAYVASHSMQDSMDDVLSISTQDPIMMRSSSSAIMSPTVMRTPPVMMRSTPAPVFADNKSQFCKDLCLALMKAGIPLSKVSESEFRSFLEKYADQPVPAEGDLRRMYADYCYNDALAYVRTELVGKKIWVSFHETVDPTDGELIGTVVVGTLSPEGPGKSFLLASGVLRDGDDGGVAPATGPACTAAAGQAAARLFDDAMGLLWPDGVHHSDVFLFLCAASPRANRIADCLATVYAKMVPVMCVARELHAVAERICTDYPDVDSLLAHTNRVFSRDPTWFARLRTRTPGITPPPEPRVPARWPTWIEAARYLSENFVTVRDALMDELNGPPRDSPGSVQLARRLVSKSIMEPSLAFVDSNYGFLPTKIAQLEAHGTLLTRAVATVFDTEKRLAEVTGDLGIALHRRFADQLAKNDGFQVLAKITDIMAGRSATMEGLPSHLSGNDLKYFKYAPVCMVDLHATFPRFEAIFSRENRIAYGEEGLNKLLVVQCNNFSSDPSATTA